MKSLQGRLLIAAASLNDPNFDRTVVLMTIHGPEGAAGLILNRPTEVELAEVWPRVSSEPCFRSQTLHHGGPVSGTLTALHDVRSLADLVVADDLYMASDLATLESLAASTEGRAVFYAGYAGWGPGQLEAEMLDGSWLTLPALPDHVFSDCDVYTLWKEAATAAGRSELQALVEPRHIPEDPQAN